ncbi:hypothetical protein A3759_14775 [Thalassolituus sp. HI0120]|nr:hypothetical protein A3759_14775 [Thalassolituus sp. HI0120]
MMQYLKLLLLLLPTLIWADDIEIYRGTADRINPNVIFIMDTSGSMGWNAAGNASLGGNHPDSRMAQVRKVAKEVVADTNGINIGLMRFAGSDRNNEGGYVTLPLQDIETARDEFNDQIDAYPTSGGTPLTETLDEAIRYLKGEPVDYANGCERVRQYNSRYGYWQWVWQCGGFPLGERSIIDGSNNYISPIVDECQKNHIVLFTDGEASVDKSSNSYIQGLISSYTDPDKPDIMQNNCSGNGGCAEELAFYTHNKDANRDLSGDQRIYIHTIGGFDSRTRDKLNDIATHGGGIASYGADSATLKSELTKIFDEISKSASSFTAPAVSVNAYNNLENLDQLYYSVFKPSDNATWYGNIKRYRVAGSEIIDAKDDPAVDPATGFFADNARSFWTLDDEAPDGDNIIKGGAASRLTLNRKVTSYLGSKSLMAAENRITESNSSLDRALLQLPYSVDPSEYTAVLQWARGVDVKDEDGDGSKTDARHYMEDPLHSRPALVTYDFGADGSNQKSAIFVATNSGVLHAFDTDESNPVEHFAFIPKELLGNLYQYYKGASPLKKVYGLDGSITAWHNDFNHDGRVNGSDTVYLYIGMRRGGKNYYALDVTDLQNPKFLWQINGGSGDFGKLGQTWSRPVKSKVKLGGVVKDVIFFAGGYDPAEDNNLTRTNHSQGNALFMIDANTGKKLWSASRSGANLVLSDMRSSIPGDVTLLDWDGDQLTDILYAADTGGRIWRIDFDNEASDASSFATGGLIADLNGGHETDNIRFYNQVDVTYTTSSAIKVDDPSNPGEKITVGGSRLQLAIGSGFRAHPLNTRVADTFYILNDYDIKTPPAEYTVVTEAELADYSKFSSEAVSKIERGLYYRLPSNGEKVMARAVTVNNSTLFTTFRPTDGSARSGCEADIGSSRLYTITPDRQLEQKDLDLPGIPPEPIILVSKPLQPDSSTDPGGGGDGDGDGDGDGGSDDDKELNPECAEYKANVFVAAESGGVLNNSCAFVRRTHAKPVAKAAQEQAVEK